MYELYCYVFRKPVSTDNKWQHEKNKRACSMIRKLRIIDRGVNSYLELGGQTVMRRATAPQRRVMFCQNLGGQLSTLPTRNWHTCLYLGNVFKLFCCLWNFSKLKIWHNATCIAIEYVHIYYIEHWLIDIFTINAYF